MDTGKLEKFAQSARRQLREQVAARMEQVLREDSAALREQADALTQLKEEIASSSKQTVIDRAAYTWFNRFVALRYMDVNFYNPVRVVSPQEGYSQPEILQDAKTGVMDDSLKVDKKRIMGLLNGEITSPNPQQEVYRLLLLGKCQQLHDDLPFLFPEIEDFTALLLPEDLLSENSILQAVRNNLEQEDCKDVEVIGWLYQFYISEKKDEVIGSKKKIQPEDIPAATQLFTPHWIVRYLVENSLGRLWLLNYPDSSIKEIMDYYIEPVEEEEEYLKVSSPEELKICDPACGSGHMLTYAFDMLYAIYEEQGYTPSEIPSLIIEKNLYGMEISERAGHLAAFALMMKARDKDSRFFEREVEPNICVFENIEFIDVELGQYMDAVGRDLFTSELEHALKQFAQAKNLGSLIQPSLTNPEYISEELNKRGIPQELFLHNTHKKVLQILEYVSFLKSKYHVVVANPPYMGSGNMNNDLKTYLKDYYKDYKNDLFSAFIIRNLEIAKPSGQLGYMSPFVWMFISSYENLRRFILDHKTITSLIQLEYSGFAGATVPICTFTLENSHRPAFRGGYIKLSEFVGPNVQAPKALEAINNQDCSWFFRTATSDFKKIPGMPISFWVKGKDLFQNESVGDFFFSGGRNKTHNNSKYLRCFWEVSKDSKDWKLYDNGGDFRKYYGNKTLIVDWTDEAREFYDSHGGLLNPKYWNKEGITWTLITSATPGFRIKIDDAIYSSAAPTIFNEGFSCDSTALGFLNSPISRYYLKALNPTLNTTVGDILKLPYLREQIPNAVAKRVEKCISASKEDWDSYERSRDFMKLPILEYAHHQKSLMGTYRNLKGFWEKLTTKVSINEVENNRALIEIYGLEGVLNPAIPRDKITLTCNPHYRYGPNKDDVELDVLLLTDTMKEFVSYSVGCMFGRYSLDEPGLILANQGDTTDAYLARIPSPSFMPDEDNVIPVLDEGWFSDDITERFKEFLRVTFGEENFTENLDFIEKAIGRDIRSFFLKEFYEYHCKMYSKPYYGKRPIYWMFESPKGYFKALIYMHRYNKDTVSIVLNDYLREFRAKLQAKRSHLERQKDNGSKQEQAKAFKELERMQEMLADLKEYEDDILYPLATQQIEIDLDDGVDVNYPKFGKALAPR